MQDLNDLYYFAMVVEHGGFAAAKAAIPALVAPLRKAA